MGQRGKALSQVQEMAITRLTLGDSITATAKHIGKDRTTVHRWLKEDYNFQARLNSVRREIYSSASNSIKSLVEPSIEVVRSAIQKGSLSAALAVLRGAGLLDHSEPNISTEDPDHLRKLAELEKVKRDLAEQGVDWDDYIRRNL